MIKMETKNGSLSILFRVFNCFIVLLNQTNQILVISLNFDNILSMGTIGLPIFILKLLVPIMFSCHIETYQPQIFCTTETFLLSCSIEVIQ